MDLEPFVVVKDRSLQPAPRTRSRLLNALKIVHPSQLRGLDCFGTTFANIRTRCWMAVESFRMIGELGPLSYPLRDI